MQRFDYKALTTFSENLISKSGIFHAALIGTTVGFIAATFMSIRKL
jgi:hypothetical protein